MSIISAEGLSREFEYYEKAEGLSGSLHNLFRRERRIKRAVDSVTFSIEEGSVVGFLGPNGAGKTTTLKILSGIMHPSSGEARVMGFVPWQRKKEFRRGISIVMGQRSQLWTDLPAMESFDLNRSIYELDRAEYRKTLDELIAAFGVEDQLAVQVRRLSLGERMKMEIIASLLHRPRVLFLDEPTIGLDLISQRAIRTHLRTLTERLGTTVMLTSHYLSDIEDLCERIILINHGAVVYDGSLSGVTGTLGDVKTVRLVFDRDVGAHELETLGNPLNSEGTSAVFEVARASVRDFSKAALDSLPVIDLTIEDAPLEDGIARLFKGERRA